MNAPADPRPDAHSDWLEALAWQVELGADEAIGDIPVNRFAEANAAAHGADGGVVPGGQSGAAGRAAGYPSHPSPLEGTGDAAGQGARGLRRAVHGRTSAPRPSSGAYASPSGSGSPAEAMQERAPVADAGELSAAARTLEELAEAIRSWAGSPLREAARNMVFCDGLAGARLMVIGEAPGGEEDRVGKPFVGRAGQLLDRMLAAIGLCRTAPAPESAVYITNILPWRPPGNRTPSELEVRQFLPFVERHIALARPDVLLTVGNTPTKALLGTVIGIKRMRGTWARHEATGLPVMPCFHPAYLLRTPEDKRLAWRDLLAVRRLLDGDSP